MLVIPFWLPQAIKALYSDLFEASKNNYSISLFLLPKP
jgi:hypothetical protein